MGDCQRLPVTLPRPPPSHEWPRAPTQSSLPQLNYSPQPSMGPDTTGLGEHLLTSAPHMYFLHSQGPIWTLLPTNSLSSALYLL